MNCKKFIFGISFLVVFSLMFNFNVPIVQTMTVIEIQSLFQQFQQQIEQYQTQAGELQERLAVIQAEPVVWCHDFKVDFILEDRGIEINALQRVLEKENFEINDAEQKDARFGSSTFAAVIDFQEKYKEAILAPWELIYGTGFVGRTTRAKLNELYGCDRIQPPILDPPIIPELPVPEYPKPPECVTDKDCRWCGDRCVKWKFDMICPMVMPPVNYKCVCRDGMCRAVKQIDLIFWDWDFCVPNRPCPIGQGDCDTDNDCAVGLFCAQNVGIQYGQHPLMDVCRQIEKIEKRYIRIFFPNRKERWTIGETYRIEWESGGVERVAIDKSAFRERTIDNIVVLPNNPGFYYWTIPYDKKFVGKFSIVIRSLEPNPWIIGASENFFIVKARDEEENKNN